MSCPQLPAQSARGRASQLHSVNMHPHFPCLSRLLPCIMQVDRVEGVLTAQDLDLKLRGLLEGPAPNPNTN